MKTKVNNYLFFDRFSYDFDVFNCYLIMIVKKIHRSNNFNSFALIIKQL